MAYEKFGFKFKAITRDANQKSDALAKNARLAGANYVISWFTNGC